VQNISLEESIEAAISNNKELNAERKSQEIAAWRQTNAFSNFLPKAHLNATVVRIDDDTYDKATSIYQLPVLSSSTHSPTGDYIPFSAGAGINKTSYRTSLVVQQPLFLGGKITLGYQMSSLAKKISDNNYHQKESDTIFQVTDIYFNILRLQELQDLTNKSIDSATAQTERIIQMKELGMARESDVLQWQVREQEHKQNLIEIEDNIAVLSDLWRIVIGLDNTTPAKIDVKAFNREIDDLAKYDSEETNSYLNDTVELVKAANPMLQITEISRALSKKSYRLAQGNFLPNLSMQFSYEIDDGDTFDLSGEKSWNIAGVLSLPLFTGGSNYSQLKIAQKELRQTELATSSAEEMLITEAKRVIRSQLRSAKNVKNSELSLKLTTSAYNTLNELHRQGMLSNQDLLDAESMFRAGEMQYITSIYDYIIAKYELKKLGVDR